MLRVFCALNMCPSSPPASCIQDGAKLILQRPFLRRASDTDFRYGTRAVDDTDTEVSFGFSSINNDDDDFEVRISSLFA